MPISYVIYYSNVVNFLQKASHQEFIFKEEGFFEMSNTKNPLKITHYTVVVKLFFAYRIMQIICGGKLSQVG